MGNIEFIKIYEDEYFFEIECKAYSDKVSVNMNAYVDNNSIDNLKDKIYQFINLKTEEFVWETSKYGNDTTPNFMMIIFYQDSVGHIRIEVYCEIDMGQLWINIIVVFTLMELRLDNWSNLEAKL